MDFSPLFSSLIALFISTWHLVALVLVLWIVTTPWFKGVFGEFVINMSARWKLDKNVYHLLTNVTLPTEHGSTQIDHIIVSVYGVFVIETKNFRGWIFGRPHQKKWIQQRYKKRYSFQNPIHQNYKNIRALQSIIDLEHKNIHSLAVFTGDCEFKTPMPENVMYGMHFIRYIQSKTEKRLSPKQVLEIIQAIEAGRMARTFKTRRAHVRHVQQLTADRQTDQR